MPLPRILISVSRAMLFRVVLRSGVIVIANNFTPLVSGFAPKKLIEQLSNSLLEIFRVDKSLVDAYDVYDCLMNYWSETMQDDCYMISSGGWTVQLYTPQPASQEERRKEEEKGRRSRRCRLRPASCTNCY